MKRGKMYVSLSLSLGIGMGMILPAVFLASSSLETDNIVYESPLKIDFTKPSIVAPRQAAITWPTSVSVHYHNDDGANDERSFYFWFTGINGMEFAPDTITNEGKDMQISFDFTSDSYSQFYKKKMFMIVKNSDSWSGKSDDTFINFEDFPPNDS